MAGSGDLSRKSLVKYGNPVRVRVESVAAAANDMASSFRQNQGSHADDILNRILPPRRWEDDEAEWIQHVSSTPATASDVTILQEQLDLRLKERRALPTGIDPARRELYAQCFDELIRQVTINCQARGILLVRIRDELRRTVEAYQTLFDSSIAYGIVKALQAAQDRQQLEEEKEQLERQVVTLEERVAYATTKCQRILEHETHSAKEDEERHEAEVSRLRASNTALRDQLKRMLGP